MGARSRAAGAGARCSGAVSRRCIVGLGMDFQEEESREDSRCCMWCIEWTDRLGRSGSLENRQVRGGVKGCRWVGR